MRNADIVVYCREVAQRVKNSGEWGELHETLEAAAAEIERLRDEKAAEIARLRDEKAADWRASCEVAVIASNEIGRLQTAIRRLAEQDATLSVCNGNVTVQIDVPLTDEQREAIRWFSEYGDLQAEAQRAAVLKQLLNNTGETSV